MCVPESTQMDRIRQAHLGPSGESVNAKKCIKMRQITFGDFPLTSAKFFPKRVANWRGDQSINIAIKPGDLFNDSAA